MNGVMGVLHLLKNEKLSDEGRSLLSEALSCGAMLAEQGRWPEAATALEQARARGLAGPRVQVALAKVRFRMGDREGSRRELERALTLDPADSEARNLLAQLR